MHGFVNLNGGGVDDDGVVDDDDVVVGGGVVFMTMMKRGKNKIKLTIEYIYNNVIILSDLDVDDVFLHSCFFLLIGS